MPYRRAEPQSEFSAFHIFHSSAALPNFGFTNVPFTLGCDELGVCYNISKPRAELVSAYQLNIDKLELFNIQVVQRTSSYARSKVDIQMRQQMVFKISWAAGSMNFNCTSGFEAQ